MIPYIAHIYGPIYANCYGLAILIGILTFLWLAARDKKLMTLVSHEQLTNIIVLGTLIGIAGGALLWGINNWQSLSSWTEILEIWHGGFSILGTVIAIGIFIPLYLAWKKIATVPFLDRIVLYAPLIQSISRIGCFFAGCCHGRCTDFCLGVTYSHPDSAAPLGIKIHPTQLYSSLALMVIFVFLYFFGQKWFKKQGQLLSLYLILIALERFFLDFLRADHEYFSFQQSHTLSSNQLIALIIMLVGFVLFLYYSFYRGNLYKNNNEHI